MNNYHSLILATLLTPFATAATPTSPFIFEDDDQSECHCELHREVTETTKYSRTFLRVIGSGFGLWGSTRKCTKVQMIKWTYDYSGPGVPPIDPEPTPADASTLATSSLTSTGAASVTIQPVGNWKFRWMNAEAVCAGDLRRPDASAVTEDLTYIALNGRSFTMKFTPVTGTLESFLGNAFDPSQYDPLFVNGNSWTGVEATLPRAAFAKPTLTFSVGANLNTPVSSMMDLSSPDSKTLAIDLGADSANKPFSILVSSTYQNDGALSVVDGVALPIILDATTTDFLTQYPNLTGTTDALGKATIQFPLVTDLAYNGEELSIAAVAHNASSGVIEKTTTYAGISMQDLSECPNE